MEEDLSENEFQQSIFCWKFSKKKQKVWIHTIVPSAVRFFLLTSSLILDSAVAACLILSDNQVSTGFISIALVYIPVIITFILKPPKVPQMPSFLELTNWFLRLLIKMLIYPVSLSLSMFKCFLWTIRAVQAVKPYSEIQTEYDALLSKEDHSYLFLQAFTHSAPQTILQIHLLILGVATNKITGFLQLASSLASLITVAICVASYHRYEAQVEGGRPKVLLMPPPEHMSNNPNTSTPLLPIRFCLQGKIVVLERDSTLGQVVAFFSWFLLISGRILCVVVSKETHPNETFIILLAHFVMMLLYLFSSQATTLRELPSRLVNAIFSLITLVEVSVRFHKMPLLYSLFFICTLAEDTYLMIYFFIYRSPKCTDGSLNCTHFGLYSYLTINSHVVGIILFGIYIAGFRPPTKSLNPSISTSIASS